MTGYLFPRLIVIHSPSACALAASLLWCRFSDPCPAFVRGTAQTDAAREGTCSYLNRSQPSYTSPVAATLAWVYSGHRTGPIAPVVRYTPRRHAAPVAWPPAGLHLAVDFSPPVGAPSAVSGITVTVHYELLQGAPSLSKWVEITAAANNSAAANVVVGNVTVELLRVNDPYSGLSYPIADGWVLGAGGGGGHPPMLLVTTDTTHGTGCDWGQRPESTYSANRYVSCRCEC
jgi:hypothetical protein